MVRIVILLALFATVARAQRAPDMATLDRGDGITKLGFDVGFSALNDPPYDAALRFELWGQWVSKIGLGFYGAIPLSRSFGGEGRPPDPEANDATSLSDIELGGLYVINGETLSIVFRGGVALPTATNGIDERLTRYYAAAPRLTDLALASDDWYIRLSVSPLVHVKRFFMRADIGIDIDVEDDNYHYFRFNVGAGVDVGLVALALELTNSMAFGTMGFFDEENFFHSLAFTVRFMGQHLQPFVAIGIPFDDYRRDRVSFFVSAGLQVAF